VIYYFIIIYYVLGIEYSLFKFNIRCLVSFITGFIIKIYTYCTKQTGKLTYFYTSTCFFYYPVLLNSFINEVSTLRPT
jgi:hypothetical protein